MQSEMQNLVYYFEQKIKYLYLASKERFYSEICEPLDAIREELSREQNKIVFFFWSWS